MLDLRLLRTFQAVASARSFTRATAALHYSQSSVTAQVQALEGELGVPLFDRSGRVVSLTSAGRQLRGYADRLLVLAEEARLAVRHQDAPAGTLTISAPETLLSYRLPGLLQAFQGAYPAVQLLLGSGSSCVPGNGLEPGVDVAFTLDLPVRAPQLVVVSLQEEAVRLVVAPDHPLARKPSLTGAELAREQFLVTIPTCGYRMLFERTLRAAGTRAVRCLDFESVEAIKQCAVARMGVGVLPRVVAAAEIALGKLVELPWPAGKRTRALTVHTQMMRHRDNWLSPNVAAFWSAAQAWFARPVAPPRQLPRRALPEADLLSR